MESTQTSLDKLIAILFVHDEPEILGDEGKALVVAISIDKKMLKRYIDLARNIRYSWQKVKRYPDYFDRFYPSNEVISEVECLTHHIHAYLDDLYTVQEKVFVLLNTLKNEANKVVNNADEFKASLEQLKEKMKKGSVELDKHRGQHRHKGMRFFHEELLRAENAEMQIAQLNGLFSSMFDEEKKKYLVVKLAVERDENFTAARKYWVETAKRNSEMLDKSFDSLFYGLGQNIYQLLGIETTARVLLALSDSMTKKNHV